MCVLCSTAYLHTEQDSTNGCGGTADQPNDNQHDFSDASTSFDNTTEVEEDAPPEGVGAPEESFEDALAILEQIAAMTERLISVIREHR